MKNAVLVAAASAFVSASALADTTTGEVVAFDRFAGRIVLADHTVYEFEPTEIVLPDTLSAGDIVEIVYTDLGEDGIDRIEEIVIVSDRT